MKHQAAGRDHRVTVFMAQYSHPNSATALGRPQQRPARSSRPVFTSPLRRSRRRG